MSNADEQSTASGIAIIGMSGRFPGAPDLASFWQHLCAGDELIQPFSDDELIAAGVAPSALTAPRYVKAGAMLTDIEQFDAAFFGINPREAELIDPQQRLFLECAWEALETAGYDSERYEGWIGVYAGIAQNSYLLFNLLSNPELLSTFGGLPLQTASDKDHLPTRVSYKLNLKGPSININTSCSTSLVAVHLACQGLLSYQCDMALAGAVRIAVPQQTGYMYQEGSILSPDGHCRAFDANAQGTVFGNGLGVVVLKRLDDALQDGDQISAVIRGSAINNDGAAKVGYTAPSVEGQAQVVALAHAIADVTPDSISYIEAHGTGTPLGDPIEIAALSEVFGASRPGSCAIGSVKTNIGHLETAAGIAGLIKTALALKHRQLPPSLHFETANPQIPFAQTPFYVNTELAAWPASDQPRRAGVSSFGIGGTNAHVILEEAPASEPSGPSRPLQLLLLSATTPAALDAATANLAHALAQPDAPPLPDVAYTLQVGRRTFAHRRMLVCHDHADAVTALEQRDPERVFSSKQEPIKRPVAFVFPGQGTQYVGMAAGLYADEPVFRAALDQCLDTLRPHLDRDLRAVLFPAPGTEAEATQQLTQTALAQPALFAVEYALAQLWLHWGVTPDALFGHSLGEFVAATLAGVFTLDGALALVALRGRLMQSTPAGAMLSVALSEAELAPLLSPPLSLAALNGPRLAVVAGPIAVIEQLAATLAAQEIEAKRLHTSHAFHSALLDPILPTFAAAVARAQPQPPQRPVISNVSGTWLTAEQATDAQYWAQQMREPVQCASALALLLHEPTRVLLELGPGTTLTTLARQQPRQPDHLLVATLPPASAANTDRQTLLTAAGQVWLAGGRIDWAARSVHEQRHRVALPTYPFQRQRYWITPGRHAALATASAGAGVELASWQRALRPTSTALPEPGAARWVVLGAEHALGGALIERLHAAGQIVVAVRAGTSFAGDAASGFTISPAASDHFRTLLDALADGPPLHLIHLWGLAATEQATHTGLISLLGLSQALVTQPPTDTARLWMLTAGARHVESADHVAPSQAALLGVWQSVTEAHPQLRRRAIDLSVDTSLSVALIQHLLAELIAPSAETIAAYRGTQRWIATSSAVPLPDSADSLQAGGTYLVYGSDSALTQALTTALIETAPARLIVLTPDPTATASPSFTAHETEIVTISIAPDQPDAIGAALAAALTPTERLAGVLAVLAPPIEPAGSQSSIEPAEAIHKIEATAAMLAALDEAVQPYDIGFRVLCTAAANDVVAAAVTHQASAWAEQSERGWLTLSWDEQPAADHEAATRLRDLLGRLIAIPTPAHLLLSTSKLGLSEPATTTAADPVAAQHNRPTLSSAYVAPEGEIERAIAAIWQTLLGIEPIGSVDNFFDLGGHSLLATQLVSRLRETFQIELPLQRLFEAPTVRGMAECIVQQRGANDDVQDAPITPRDHSDRLPLSFAQQRLWFLEQLFPNSSAYNMPTAVRLTGRLHRPALERSLNEIVGRHEALRTTFSTVDGRPIQIIHATMPLALPLVDLSDRAEREREAEIQRLAQVEAQRPFDLERGPIVRALLIRAAEHEHVLVLTVHHIASDAWSMGVFVRELTSLYAGFSTDAPATLPALPIQYADFTLWQRARLQGAFLDEQLWYWQQQLHGPLPTLNLPTDRPRPPTQTFNGAHATLDLPPELSAALTALGREAGATLFMTLLAGFKVLLHWYTEQDDLIVGTDVAGRTRRETEALIGFFVNQLVLRTNLGGDPTFRDVLSRVRDVTLGAYAHQELPFDKLVDALTDRRDTQRTPLFQIKVVLQNAPMSALELPGLSLGMLDYETTSAKFDLLLNLIDTPHGLRALVEYNTDLFDPATIDALLARYATVLESAVARPEQPVSEFAAQLRAAQAAQQLQQRERRRQQLRSLPRKGVQLQEKEQGQ